MSLSTSIEYVFARMQQAARCRLYLNHPPVLVGASKGQSTSVLEEAIRCGVQHFGENRVQEAVEKWPFLKICHPELILHYIGPLQSNKVREAVALFDVIETVDREKIACAIAKEAKQQGKTIECLIQVNVGEEPQKTGISPGELEDFLTFCRGECGLSIKGLMAIPPADTPPGPYFALMQSLAKCVGLEQLSMGMSADFETAIRFGATHVRVGTALFGARG